jgi:predicted dehydrogenase
MAAKRFGVGVIGTGWVAGAHIDTFKQVDGCEVVAICSRDKTRAEAKIHEHGLMGAVAYDNLKSFLKHPGLDIVVICTPHPNHPAETIAAANAGKHIVIEKPLASNRRDLAKMVAAVNKNKVLTSVCFELRWIGSIKNTKVMLDEGLIGRPFYGEASYFHGIGPWYKQWAWNIKKEIGWSSLLTAGCHAVDTLIYLMDSPVTEVAAMESISKANPLKYEYAPNTVFIMKFANGAIGKVASSIECRQPYLFPVLLQGEQGSIWNNQYFSTKLPGQRGWATIPAGMPDSGDVSDHPYKDQMVYFIDCIKSGKRPHNDIHSAAHVHEVMFATEESIRTKKTIKVPATPGT